MLVLVVHIHVKPESVEDFITATRDNASNSILEEGVIRFDAIQQTDDPTRFMLYEVYNAPEDHLKHRETAHFARWRDTVANMMAEPRQGVRYVNIFPDDVNWKKSAH
jgi:autoinducer 2-degrading protein